MRAADRTRRSICRSFEGRDAPLEILSSVNAYRGRATWELDAPGALFDSLVNEAYGTRVLAQLDEPNLHGEPPCTDRYNLS